MSEAGGPGLAQPEAEAGLGEPNSSPPILEVPSVLSWLEGESQWVWVETIDKEKVHHETGLPTEVMQPWRTSGSYWWSPEQLGLIWYLFLLSSRGWISNLPSFFLPQFYNEPMCLVCVLITCCLKARRTDRRIIYTAWSVSVRDLCHVHWYTYTGLNCGQVFYLFPRSLWEVASPREFRSITCRLALKN